MTPPPDRPRSGLYLVRKPPGPTSHALVRAWLPRAEAFGLRMCHAGTLDPFAEGLLVLLVGPATRLMDVLHDAPKTYEARVCWGRETETGDSGGRTVSEAGTAPTPEAAKEALRAHIGWGEQVPPATSARKIGGEPAYRKAHRGEHVELPASRVYLHSGEWPGHDGSTSHLRITCRGGFYVRALARDLGRTLGCGAHLSALSRTAHGPWTPPPAGCTAHIRGRDALPWLPAVRLDDVALKTLRRDGALPGDIPRENPVWSPPASAGVAFPFREERAAAVHEDRLVAVLRRSPAGWQREIDLMRGL